MKVNSKLMVIVTFLLCIFTFSPTDECLSNENSSFYRAIHMGGNYGVVEDIVAMPDDYFNFLKSLNADWIGISIALHYENSMDSTVERKYSEVATPTFTDEVLVNLIRKFKSYGFKVYLTLAFESFEAENSQFPVARYQLGDPNAPLVDPNIHQENWPWSLSHPNHQQFVSDFWDSYTDQVVHFANIAEQEQVELFSLGTETEGLFRTRSGAGWPNHFLNELREMVASVRSVYNGKITYDMAYHATKDVFFSPGSSNLWSDLGLDVIGISAYYELSDTIPTSVIRIADLKIKWVNIFTNYIQLLKNKNPNIPILFLEFGYDDSLKAPFSANADTHSDRVFIDNDNNGLDDGQEMQANIYESFFSVMEQYPDLVQGAFLWGHMMISDISWFNSFAKMREMSVRDKLSENVVKSFYSKWAGKKVSLTTIYLLLLK